MHPINKNWTDSHGYHDGGHSLSEWFTIAWQRGPMGFPPVPENRNGAFLIEVLKAVLEAVEVKSANAIGPTDSSGLGFTILWPSQMPDFYGVLRSLLNSCILYLSYCQSQERFSCSENALAIALLTDAREPGQSAENVKRHIRSAIESLEARRNRRSIAQTLGTMMGDNEPA